MKATHTPSLLLRAIFGCTGLIACGSEVEEPDDEIAMDQAAALGRNCVASAALGGFTTYAHFTNPYAPCVPTSANAQQDQNIENELKRLIQSVPAGSYIRGNIYSATETTIANALVAAENRGVHVQISADAQIASEKQAAESILRSLDHMNFCPGATGCIANVSGGHAHTKLFTFSRTKRPGASVATHVTWFASYNLTNGASGSRGFNNSITVYGDEALYDQARDHLNRMYEEAPRTSDYYDPPSRGRFVSSSATVYSSPQAQTDLVVDRLEAFTPNSQCQVRVANPWLLNNRSEVTDQLCSMRRGGCRVWVLTNTKHVDSAQLRALKGCGISVRVPLDGDGDDLLHDKLMIVRGRTSAGLRHRVFGGSHNFADDSLKENDDLLVQMADDTSSGAAFYSAFVAHFGDAWGGATTLTERMLKR
jgi:phosphatidylserine/phosphatidylglycerophosphate/cardiolipin synthase-like enzyme